MSNPSVMPTDTTPGSATPSSRIVLLKVPRAQQGESTNGPKFITVRRFFPPDIYGDDETTRGDQVRSRQNKTGSVPARSTDEMVSLFQNLALQQPDTTNTQSTSSHFDPNQASSHLPQTGQQHTGSVPVGNHATFRKLGEATIDQLNSDDMIRRWYSNSHRDAHSQENPINSGGRLVSLLDAAPLQLVRHKLEHAAAQTLNTAPNISNISNTASAWSILYNPTPGSQSDAPRQTIQPVEERNYVSNAAKSTTQLQNRTSGLPTPTIPGLRPPPARLRSAARGATAIQKNYGDYSDTQTECFDIYELVIPNESQQSNMTQQSTDVLNSHGDMSSPTGIGITRGDEISESKTTEPMEEFVLRADFDQLAIHDALVQLAAAGFTRYDITAAENPYQRAFWAENDLHLIDYDPDMYRTGIEQLSGSDYNPSYQGSEEDDVYGWTPRKHQNDDSDRSNASGTDDEHERYDNNNDMGVDGEDQTDDNAILGSPWATPGYGFNTSQRTTNPHRHSQQPMRFSASGFIDTAKPRAQSKRHNIDSSGHRKPREVEEFSRNDPDIQLFLERHDLQQYIQSFVHGDASPMDSDINDSESSMQLGSENTGFAQQSPDDVAEIENRLTEQFMIELDQFTAQNQLKQHTTTGNVRFSDDMIGDGSDFPQFQYNPVNSHVSSHSTADTSHLQDKYEGTNPFYQLQAISERLQPLADHQTALGASTQMNDEEDDNSSSGYDDDFVF